MRSRYVLIALVLALTTTTSSFHSAAADSRRITDAEITAQVLDVFNSGRALERIDRGLESGSLTWSEAEALYAEQAAIRSAYIRGKTLHGTHLAGRRAAFMLRTSQSTYARLAFNDVQRRPARRQVTWAW